MYIRAIICVIVISFPKIRNVAVHKHKSNSTYVIFSAFRRRVNVSNSNKKSCELLTAIVT